MRLILNMKTKLVMCPIIDTAALTNPKHIPTVTHTHYPSNLIPKRAYKQPSPKRRPDIGERMIKVQN